MEGHPSSSEKRALRKVLVVFKTHFDLGFTGLPDEVMALYTGRMFSQVREVVAATSAEPVGLRYNWTLPAWPLKQLLHDPSLPEETRAAARSLVEQGALSWHAWPFTTHTAFCSLEELVRGLHISRSLSEEFGRWPTGAKQTDVPGHTWILPSMLVRAGVKFLHLGCNSGSHAPHVPRLFWWEGPDGARLLTWYSPGGYGTPLLPPDDWPLDTWLAVQQTVDNVGPHSPEELRRIRETITQGAPGAEILFGELGDFAESLLEHPEQLESLPIVPYDLADTWIHGIGTMPREVARVRELRAMLIALEEAATVHEWPRHEGDSTDFLLARRIAPIIDAAYEQLLLFGEHTWGLDVKSTIKRMYGDQFEQARQTEPYRRLESSWEAKAAYVERAEELYKQAESLVRTATEAQPHAVLRDEEGRAKDRSATPQPTSPADTTPDNVLETPELRIEVDPATGGIVSLIARRIHREWVDKSSAEPFGGYRYDLYSIVDIAEFMRAYGLYFQDWFVHDFGKQGYPEDSQHITAYARDFKLEKLDESHLLLSGGRLQATRSQGVSLPEQTMSIVIKLGYEFSYPYIDLEYHVEGKQATPLAESTVVPFPLNLPKPTFRLGQTGSIIDPARDIIEGANRSLWCADWLDASDDRVGLGLIPIDMPLLSIGNTGIYRFEPDRRPSEPLVYAHLSNTQWGTNFPQWLEGDFRWRIRIIPEEVGRGFRSQLVFNAERAQGVNRFHSNLPFKLESLSAVRLLSVRPRHDGGGVILRVAESHGHHYSARLSLGEPVSSVWLCDLMERPIERLHIYKGPELAGGSYTVNFDLEPFGVGTLLVEFSKEEQTQ